MLGISEACLIDFILFNAIKVSFRIELKTTLRAHSLFKHLNNSTSALFYHLIIKTEKSQLTLKR